MNIFRFIQIITCMILTSTAAAQHYAYQPSTPIIGKIQTIQARSYDTFEQLARTHDIGYDELLHANPDINPYTSLDLSIYSGEGFCRHFSLTTKKILDHMRLKVRMSYAPEHAFLKFKKNNLDFIFDPSFSNGFHSCNFLLK